MAWAQVLLAKGDHPLCTTWVNPWWVGWGAFACVGLLGLSSATALYFGWLEPKWSGVLSYVGPLVLWQGSACLLAAFSFRPFKAQVTRIYSWACMVSALFQLTLLLIPTIIGMQLNAFQHISLLAILSSIQLILITVLLAKLK